MSEKGKASARRRGKKYGATEKGKESRRKSIKKWREKNRDKVLAAERLRRSRGDVKARMSAAHAKWAALNHDKVIALGRRWYRNNTALILARRFESKYGVPRSNWDAMFKAQGCVCALCRTGEPRGRTGWHTDHDHATGKIRGILCHRCNTGLGLLGDTRERLLAAVEYLGRSDSAVSAA